MRSLVIVSVVLGVAFGQVFPRDTPEVEAARNAFIAEYNRLARLAEQAPDIHIYHRDPEQDLAAPTGVRPLNPPSFNAFSFQANLGSNQQFVPGPHTFPGASHMPGHLAGHLAGHQTAHHVPAVPTRAPQAVQFTPVPAVRRITQAPRRITQAPLFSFTEEPIQRWTGPFADEVPAGLSGHVMETPSVAAAKAAHFQAHADFWNQATRKASSQG